MSKLNTFKKSVLIVVHRHCVPKEEKNLYEMVKLGQITHLRNKIVIGFQNKYGSVFFQFK